MRKCVSYTSTQMGDRLNLERQRQKNKVKAAIDLKTEGPGPVLSDSTALMQLIQLYTAQHSNTPPVVTPLIPICPPPQNRQTSNGSHTHAADTMTCEKAEIRNGTDVVQKRIPSTVSKNKYCAAVVDACETGVMDLTASDDDDDNGGDVDGGDDGGDDGWVSMARDGSKEYMNKMASNDKVSTVKSESIRVTAKEKERESAMSEETSSWTCSTCTCLNPILVKFCEACLQPYSKNKTTTSTSTVTSTVKGKGKRRLSVKDESPAEIISGIEAKADSGARSSKSLNKKKKTLEQVTLLHNVDNNSGMIQFLDNDSDSDREKESYCFIPHDQTIKNGNKSERRNLIGEGEGEHHSRDRNKDGSVESVFAFQLPEPLPLLPLTIDPQAALVLVPSQITTSDSFLDSDHMLSADDINHHHMQSNALSSCLPERTSSISERFSFFGYEYPTERIDLSDLALLKLTGPDSIVRARMPGTDSLHGLSSTSEKHSPCDCDEVARTRTPDDDQYNWIWDPDTCVVFGKRYGDPKRKGKSKFCGMAEKATVHLIIHPT